MGTAQTHHTIRSSASVAKYCAKKLSKECSVLAVNNGKIVFHRESSLAASRVSVKGSFLLLYMIVYVRNFIRYLCLLCCL